MKFCNNCGEKLKSGELYCSNCGKSVENEIVVENKKEGLGTASMIIGIISLILVFIISLGVLPLALCGLILGIVNKTQKGKKVSGIILNTIAMILSFIVFIILIIILMVKLPEVNYNEHTYIEPMPNEETKEEVLGVWNCKNISNIKDDNYELTLTVNNDNTFILSKYDSPKNYIEGTYEFEESEVDRFIKPYKFCTLELEGKKEYKNGDYKGEIDVDYDMVITKTKKDMHAVISNDENNTPYYCTK